MDEPIERRKVYEQIAERLQAHISERKWRPGDSLPTERELMQTYRVGRSSVREALRILESRGLIQSLSTGGFAIASYGNSLNHSIQLLLLMQEINPLELFEMRMILEVEVAGLAATRRSSTDVAQMARAIEDMVEGLSAEDRYIAADLQFHMTIAEASRNRIAVHMMQAIRELLHRALASIYHIPGSPQRSIAQHREIRAAIATGRPEDARRSMRDHLLRVQSDIQGVLAEGPMLPHASVLTDDGANPRRGVEQTTTVTGERAR